MTPLLILTHTLAAIFGGALVYFIVLRAGGIPPHRPHLNRGDRMNTDPAPDESLTRRQRVRRWLASHRQPPTWVVIVVASAIVVVIGVQATLVSADNRKRDDDDRARQTCLNEFAADLVSTIQARAEANRRVLAAQTRKDEALDAVFDLLAANNAAPAKTSKEEAAVRKKFEEAVAERVAAQSALRTAKANAEATLNENPYEVPKTPKAVC